MSWVISSSNFIAETVDYQQRLAINGGSALTSWLPTVDTLIKGLKTDAVWSKISDLHIFAGVTTLQGSLVPIKTSANATIQATGLDSAAHYISSGPDLGINDYTLPLSNPSRSLSIATTALQRDAAYGVFGAAGNAKTLLAPSSGSFPQIYENSDTTVMFAAYGFGGADYVQAATSRLAGDAIFSRESASLMRAYVNGTLKGTNSGTTSTSPSASGLTLFSGTNGARRISAYFVAPNATSAEALLIRGRIATALSEMGNVNGITTFVTYGDSITEGYGGATPYSAYLRSYVGWSGRWANTATQGFRSDTSAYGAINTTNLSRGIKAYRPDTYYSTRGLAFLWFGTNDLKDGTGAATILTNLRTLWSTARTQGYRVIAFTIAPRSDTGWTASMETERQSLNSSIITDSANWDALIRVDQILTDPTNATYYQADKLHLTSEAGALIASTIAAQINPATV